MLLLTLVSRLLRNPNMKTIFCIIVTSPCDLSVEKRLDASQQATLPTKTIDANAILLCPIKNRTDQELRMAYRSLLGRAKATGLEVKSMLWIMSDLMQ